MINLRINSKRSDTMNNYSWIEDYFNSKMGNPFQTIYDDGSAERIIDYLHKSIYGEGNGISTKEPVNEIIEESSPEINAFISSFEVVE